VETYLSLRAVVVLTLFACGGSESGGEGTDEPAGSGGSAQFCELGFRIGDTSTRPGRRLIVTSCSRGDVHIGAITVMSAKA
jgi:hypothetical protein